MAACSNSWAPSWATRSRATARSAPPANTSSICACSRSHGDTLFGTDVGSFLSWLDHLREEPTSVPFYTDRETRPVAAAAGTGLLSETPWQRLIDSVDTGRPVDTATVQLMQDRTADLFHTEESVPARQLLEAIAQHHTTLETLLANARTESFQRDLAVALGETDVLPGWL